MVSIFNRFPRSAKAHPDTKHSTPLTGDALQDQFFGEVDQTTGEVHPKRIALRSSSEDLQKQVERFRTRIAEGERTLGTLSDEAATTERQHLDSLRAYAAAHEQAAEIALNREAREELLFDQAEKFMRDPKTRDATKIAAIEKLVNHISEYVRNLGTTEFAQVDLARLQAMAAAVQIKHSATRSNDWLSLRAKIDSLCQRLWSTRDANDRRISTAYTPTAQYEDTRTADEDDIVLESPSDLDDEDNQPPA